MIIGLSGFAGAGKDTVADILRDKHNFVKLALADPLKRICRDVFAFTDAQLWGPSSERNKPDLRYPRDHSWIAQDADEFTVADPECFCCGIKNSKLAEAKSEIKCYLTPRYALQKLGTEWGRDCYTTVWSELALRIAKQLMTDPKLDYTAYQGVKRRTDGTPPAGIVIPDIRFISEMKVLRDFDTAEDKQIDKNVSIWHEDNEDPRGLPEVLGMSLLQYTTWVETGVHNRSIRLVRITRPGFEEPRYDHPSETEQLKIPNSDFDYIYRGGDTLDGIEAKVAQMLEELRTS